MKAKLVWMPLLCMGAILAFWIATADGRAFRVDKLPDKGNNWGCGTCHINAGGGGARNAFGKDWEKIAIPAGDVYTKQLRETDSDGDGFTNDEEFNADPPTEPWNAQAKPKEAEPQTVRAQGKRASLWANLKRR